MICDSDACGSQIYVWNLGGVCPFTGGCCGLRMQAVLHVNKDSASTTIFLLFFMEVTELLVAETNKYYSQYLGTFDVDVNSHDFQM
jgi:hypothetical protein